VGIFALDHLGATGVAVLMHALLASTSVGLLLVGQRIFRKAVLA
jgi:hypothetical protein